MRTLFWTTLLTLSATTWAGGGPVEPRATSIRLIESTFGNPEIVVGTSMPPQFDITFKREMPTTGWDHVLDSVTVDSGRIVVKLTEVRPLGTVAQVITPTTFRLPLGRLTPGRYLLELWVRRGTDHPHALSQALVLAAR